MPRRLGHELEQTGVGGGKWAHSRRQVHDVAAVITIVVVELAGVVGQLGFVEEAGVVHGRQVRVSNRDTAAVRAAFPWTSSLA